MPRFSILADLDEVAEFHRARRGVFTGIGAAPPFNRSETDDEAAVGASVGLPYACRRRARAHSGGIEANRGLIGGVNGAASLLGLPRTTLVHKMRKLGIEARRSHRSRSIDPARDGLARERLDAVGSF